MNKQLNIEILEQRPKFKMAPAGKPKVAGDKSLIKVITKPKVQTKLVKPIKKSKSELINDSLSETNEESDSELLLK